MRNFFKNIFFIFVILLLASCGGKYMIKQGPLSKPEPGKALVNFVRPSFLGKAVKVSLWDGDKLVGICYEAYAMANKLSSMNVIPVSICL
jgi:predicted small lipoprotein YifL